MSAPPLLAVNGLSVDFASAAGMLAAVDEVEFTIERGRTLALVGESGSGKSMTALSILQLTPLNSGVRIKGEIRLEGRDLARLSEPAMQAVRGGRIGMVFQEPSSCLNPIMTIGRQIGEAVAAHAGGPVDISARVARLLEEVGLAGVPDGAKRYPHELSGGQQQRVMIAMALAGDPLLLIADEPTTALDVTVQAQILDLLASLQAKRGMAMLFISHDLGVVASIAHEIAVMRAGRIVERGATAELLSAPREEYTRSLLACRPRLDQRLARLPVLSDFGQPSPLAPVPASRGDGAPLLTIAGLRVLYPGRGWLSPPVAAVEGVDLSLARGAALGIVGESGSGKSSIARAIVGLAPIAAGAIIFDGAALDARALTRREVRRRIQYIFQDAYGALNPRHNVEKLLREPLDVHGLNNGPDARGRLVRLLQEVGLEASHLSRYPRELSGGQRQRVTIARALALEPDLLICDEIVSALDVSIQAQILNLLKDIQARRGLTLLFISHDFAVVRFVCDQLVVMRAGRIVESGDVEALIDHPQAPYTRELIAAVRKLDQGVPEPAQASALEG